MAERQDPLHRALKAPAIYGAVQRALGADRFRERITADLLKPRPGLRVLDIGCGPAVLRDLLGDVAYTGIDFNARHIAEAQARARPGDRYLVGDATDEIAFPPASFDLVLMIGLLHHIDDAGCSKLLARAGELTAPGGRAITLDGIKEPKQRPLARLLASMDAGKMVRSAAGYLSLTEGLPVMVEQRVYHGLLRVPFDHCAMTLTPVLT